jgi:serine protease Do
MERKNNLKDTIIWLLIIIIVSGLSSTLTFIYLSNHLLSQFSSSNLASFSTRIKNNASTSGVSSLLGEEQQTMEAVTRANQSVVNIVVTKEITVSASKNSTDDFFNQFFFDLPGYTPPAQPDSEANQQKELQEVGGGSGFVINKEKRLILTNKHVVSDTAAKYTVISNEGKKYDAEVLARDPFNDLAILKVKNLNLPAVTLGDSDKLKIGQTVIAIGNSLGEYRNTITKGVISGIGRKIVASGLAEGAENLDDVIQTDAAINFGNSGGPLINLQGEVIGINTAVSLEGQLIGFAIPINQVKVAIASVEKTGKISQPFLGVRYVMLNKAIAEKNKLSVNQGALILRGESQTDLAIMPGSPADKADLKEGDIILEVNGQKVDEDNILSSLVRKYKIGDKIKLKVLSKGAEKIVQVVLEEYKS